jgi:hypothetical protein
MFHPANLNGFPNNTYGDGLSEVSVATVAAVAGHDNLTGQHQQNQQPQRKQLPHQRQTHPSPGVSPGAASSNTTLPSLGQFGMSAPTPTDGHVMAGMPRNGSADPARASPATPANDPAGLEPSRSGQQLPAKFVENPPHLDLWRQKLFDLEETVILTPEE